MLRLWVAAISAAARTGTTDCAPNRRNSGFWRNFQGGFLPFAVSCFNEQPGSVGSCARGAPPLPLLTSDRHTTARPRAAARLPFGAMAAPSGRESGEDREHGIGRAAAAAGAAAAARLAGSSSSTSAAPRARRSSQSGSDEPDEQPPGAAASASDGHGDRGSAGGSAAGAHAADGARAAGGAGGGVDDHAGSDGEDAGAWDVEAEEARVAALTAAAAEEAAAHHLTAAHELWAAKREAFEEISEYERRRRKAQEDAAANYTHHFTNWKLHVDDAVEAHGKLQRFVEGRAAADARYAEQLAELRTLVDLTGGKDGEPLPEDATSYDVTAHQLSLLHQELAARVADFADRATKEVLERSIAPLAKKYTKEAKAIVVAGDKHLVTLMHAARAADAAFDEYSSAFRAMEAAHRSGKPLAESKCQWLEELKYRQAARAMERARKSYVGEMAALFKQMGELEKKRTEFIRAALQRYAQLASRLFAGFEVPTGEVYSAAARLETKRDFINDLNRNEDHLPDAHREATSAPPVLPALASSMVVAWGCLKRQTSVLRRWTPVLVVVTRDMFLHAFDATEDFAMPVGWRVEQFCGFHRGPFHSGTAARSTATTQEKADAEAEAVARSGPSFSVHLTRAKLGFAPTVHEHAFEVVEVVSSMVFFSSTRRMVFRAASSDEMVEWMIALGEVTRPAAAPANPPVPPAPVSQRSGGGGGKRGGSGD